MDEEELTHLQEFAAKASRADVQATVRDDDDGWFWVEAVSIAGGGEPRTVTRSAKFTTRDAAEAFVRDVIDTARSH